VFKSNPIILYLTKDAIEPYRLTQVVLTRDAMETYRLKQVWYLTKDAHEILSADTSMSTLH